MQSNAARVGLLAALAAVAVVLFVVLSGGDDDDGGSETTATEPAATATATAPAPAEPETFEIELRDGAPAGGVGELEVAKGDTVRIAVRSDEDAEVHVHGYEIEDEVAPGAVTRLKFTADIDGKFEIEAHSHATGDIPLAELTVQPG
ncbi:MAG: hypothetical protein ACXWF9_09045 [Solirubrobacterales bacterium]